MCASSFRPSQTYDLYGPVRNAFDAGKSVSWARGRGLGPEIRDFFGSQMALVGQLDAISQGPKKSQFLQSPHIAIFQHLLQIFLVFLVFFCPFSLRYCVPGTVFPWKEAWETKTVPTSYCILYVNFYCSVHTSYIPTCTFFSVAVQNDFVRLSQSLQVELEKIRQGEKEVRSILHLSYKSVRYSLFRNIFITLTFLQCSGSDSGFGSTRSTCFWASRIRIH